MTPSKKRIASVKAPVHPVSILAVILAAVGLAGQVFGWWSQSHPPSRAQVAKVAAPVAAKQAKITLKQAAVRFVGAAANAPQPANQSCTVPAGQGVMGACAPKPGLGLLGGALTASTSSATRVHGLIGTDTSSYQGCVAAPKWVSFWIVKATEGTGYRDRCTATDVKIAKAQHQVCGVYDFMRATGSFAGAEADTFISYSRSSGAEKCIHVLDVEAGTLPAATMHAYVCSWVDRVRAAFPGQPVVIYTGNWFWGPRVGGSTCGAVLWDSAYASYAQLPATWGGGFLTPTGWAPYTAQRGVYRALSPMWQYSDGVYGPVPRVNRWDTDVFFGSRAQLEQLAGNVRPCSARTACRMGRRHAHVHRTIVTKCHGAPAASHRKICRALRGRNSYMHRYARRHHLTFTTG